LGLGGGPEEKNYLIREDWGHSQAEIGFKKKSVR